MDTIDDADALQRALLKMTEEQRNHLKVVITELVQCYLRDDRHGLLLLGADGTEAFKIISVNTNEMHASQLLTAADQYVNFRVMDDAPPKELFN